jgi:hypothetical protein
VSSRSTRSARSAGFSGPAPSRLVARHRPPRGPAWFQALGAGHRRVLSVLLWAVGGLALLVVSSMVIDAAVYSNKIHAGVTISGQDMAGLSRAEATAIRPGSSRPLPSG